MNERTLLQLASCWVLTVLEKVDKKTLVTNKSQIIFVLEKVDKKTLVTNKSQIIFME